MKINAENFKDSLHRFSLADADRLFNFSSGHLGALPIPVDEIAGMLVRRESVDVRKLIYLFLIESLKFLVFFILPIKNLSIVFRAFLRKVANRQESTSNAMTVLSLGRASLENDAYFGPLLRTVEGNFNYIKIVGGGQFRAKGFQYIENSLCLITLLKLLVNTPAYPLIFVFKLLRMLKREMGCRERLLFFALGLRDINTGTALSNLIVFNAFVDHVNWFSVRKVLYPMEGRNWEKKIVRVMNENNIYSIGYFHCALTPRHLSLLDARFNHSIELPSSIVAPSQMAYNILSRRYPEKNVVKGYFLRGDKMPPRQIEKNARKLIFALTASIQESKEIINHAAILQRDKGYEVVIRLNPNSASYRYLCKYAENLDLKIFNKNVAELPIACFFRSSSVALDYLKLAVLPIYIDMQDVISNNVFDLDNQFEFVSVSLSESFSEEVDTIIKKFLVMPILDGSKVSDYYLDQSYCVDDLPLLLNQY